MFRPVLVAALTLSLQAGSPPAWVQGQGNDPLAYPATRYLTGFGLSEPDRSEAEQRRQALAMAQEALASAIRVRVSSDFVSRVTLQDQRVARYARNQLRTRADLELEGLDAVQVWQDPKGHLTYALAILDKPRTLLLLSGQWARQAGECHSLFERGCQTGELPALIQARQVRERLDETLAIGAILGGAPPALAAPSGGAIDQELRKAYARIPGLDGAAALAALDLQAGLPRGLRVLMDRITFGDTGHGGTFSAAWIQALGAQLAALGRVRILDPLAEPGEAEGVVRGTCFRLGDQVHVQLRVTAPGGEELASVDVAIPADRLSKAGLSLEPPPLRVAAEARLEVRVAADRGAGGIYRSGDKLQLSLQANRDCYTKVIYQQADGRKILIFPNRYHPDSWIRKGQVYAVPPEDHRFDFVVSAPFGPERVKVIACTEPIDVRSLPPDANGLSEVAESLTRLMERTRGILLRKPEAEVAEDTVVVTTMR